MQKIFGTQTRWNSPFGIGQPFRMASVVEWWSNWCKCSTPSHLVVKFDYFNYSNSKLKSFCKTYSQNFPSNLVFISLRVYLLVYQSLVIFFNAPFLYTFFYTPLLNIIFILQFYYTTLLNFYIQSRLQKMAQAFS